MLYMSLNYIIINFAQNQSFVQIGVGLKQYNTANLSIYWY